MVASHIIKRLFDVLFSLIAIISFLPLFYFIYLSVKIDSTNSGFFKQRRIGKNGKEFYIYKIRTIRNNRPTKFGKFLRKTFLDELPQFVNILKGEMSLVGPRPEVFEIAKDYNQEQRKRLFVKPGLTGLWQISPYRDEPIHNHLEYDFYYIDNQSFWLDLKIMFKTLFVFLSRLLFNTTL